MRRASSAPAAHLPKLPMLKGRRKRPEIARGRDTCAARGPPAPRGRPAADRTGTGGREPAGESPNARAPRQLGAGGLDFRRGGFPFGGVGGWVEEEISSVY